MASNKTLIEIIVILIILLTVSLFFVFVNLSRPVVVVEEEVKEEPVKPAEPGCQDLCTEDFCNVFNSIECIESAIGCNTEKDNGIILGKCGVNCLSDLNCKTGQVCTHNYKCGIVETTTESMEDVFARKKADLERQKDIEDKLDRCTRLCAGSAYGIPATKDKCYSECYDAFYYKGEAGLNEYMASVS